MDPLFLIIGLPAAVLLATAYLPFFNRGLKDDLDSLEKEKNDLLVRQERFEVRLGEKDKKLEKLQARIEKLDKDLATERQGAKGNRKAAQKLKTVESDFENRESRLVRRSEEAEAVLKEVQEDLLRHKQRGAELAADLKATESERDRLQEKLLVVPKAEPVKPVPEPVVKVDNSEAEGLANENRDLKRTIRNLRKEMAGIERQMKTVRRKNEHNRRAYMITLLQLDLAQDELCMLKTGKPRRQTALSRQQVPGSVEPDCAEPETVEELVEDAAQPDEVAEAIPVPDVSPPALPPAKGVIPDVDVPAEVVETGPDPDVSAEVVETAPDPDVPAE
jgi:hypothetical protein